MKSWSKPTVQQVEGAIALMKKREQYRYFFDHLENPEWILPLRERGFFKLPPQPIEQGAQVSFPEWPESRYLARVASDAPQLVLGVIMQIPATENFRVHEDFLEAVRKMPVDQAADMAPLAVQWIEKPYVGLLPKRAAEFMVFLSEGGQLKAALRLLSALTEPDVKETSITLPDGPTRVRREAKPRQHSWYFSQLLEKDLPTLVKADPLGVANVLETQLRKCIHLEARQLPGGDGSYLWRRAIEDHPQHWGGDDLKNMLTVGLRDSLESAVVHRPEAARSILESYLANQLSIFRRLALHLLRLGGQQYRELSASVLQDSRFRDDDTLHHEYYRLLQDRFGSLTQQAQLHYLDWIERGPDVEEFSRWEEAETGEGPAEEDIKRHIRRWQLEQLMPVRNGLTADWGARYEALADEFGEPEHPEFRIWSSTTWVGPTSPRKKEDLADTGPAGTLEYLKTFEPTGDAFDHSREGLARELQGVVTEKPAGYLDIAHCFLGEGIHPTYVYHLVVGFHEAWKKGVGLDWTRLLDFFEPISLALTGNGPALAQPVIARNDVDWVGVRMAISRFLSGALRVDDRPLADEIMSGIRDVLLRLVQDPDPSREDEERRAGSAMDWVTIRINSARGVAASALLEYALRYARMHKAEQEATRPDEGYARRLEPGVKVAFTRMLDKSVEPTAAVHSLFGEFLPNFRHLDRDWTVSNLDRIFPWEPQKQRYWEAAWEGYMLYCPRVYRELYEMLRPQYYRAVRALADNENSRAIRSTNHALAGHIAIAYRMGYEELEASSDEAAFGVADVQAGQSLLSAFLDEASDELRAVLTRALGGALGVEEAVPSEQWTRLRTYWEARTQFASRAPGEYEMDKELSAFASWVDAVPEQVNALAPLLRCALEHLTTGHDAHQLLDYLAKQSDNHPKLAADMLGLLLARQAALHTGPDVDRIYLIGAEQQIWDILQNAMAGDATAQQSAISVINLLGERGDYRYRDLLTEAS